jgi:hypothetical protein
LAAWCISIFCHLLLFTAVAVWAGSTARGLEGPEEVEQEIVVKLLPEPAAPAVATEDPHSGSRPESPATSAPTSDASAKQLLDQPFEQPLPRVGGALPRPELNDTLNSDLKLATDLPRVVMPTPRPQVETEFFGSQAKGTRFVYVIDRSASMQIGLAPAKAELLASLERLPPTAEFQVVLYDLEPRVLEINNQQGLLVASKENKHRTARFLDTIRSEGGTDHVKALKRGLSLMPHVVYFLTDADELKPGQVQELTALNQRGPRAAIHCIELSLINENRKDNPMRVLARDNQGEYRAVDLLRRRP